MANKKQRLRAITKALRTAKDSLEQLVTDTTDAYDDLSDKAQDGDRGMALDITMNTLEDAVSDLENMIGNLDEISFT